MDLASPKETINYCQACIKLGKIFFLNLTHKARLIVGAGCRHICGNRLVDSYFRVATNFFTQCLAGKLPLMDQFIQWCKLYPTLPTAPICYVAKRTQM